MKVVKFSTPKRAILPVRPPPSELLHGASCREVAADRGAGPVAGRAAWFCHFMLASRELAVRFAGFAVEAGENRIRC